MSSSGEKGPGNIGGDRADFGSGKPLRNPGGKLGEILVAEGVITQLQLSEALRLRDEQKGFLGKALCNLKFIDQATLTSFLVKQCKIPHLNLLDYELSDKVRDCFPEELCARHRVLPVEALTP